MPLAGFLIVFGLVIWAVFYSLYDSTATGMEAQRCDIDPGTPYWRGGRPISALRAENYSDPTGIERLFVLFAASLGGLGIMSIGLVMLLLILGEWARR